MKYNKYYLLNQKGKRTDLFVAYSDIGAEFGVSRNSIAGKFYRARKIGSNIIDVNGNKIEQVRG
jgi:hypothetical protein